MYGVLHIYRAMLGEKTAKQTLMHTSIVIKSYNITKLCSPWLCQDALFLHLSDVSKDILCRTLFRVSFLQINLEIVEDILELKCH